MEENEFKNIWKNLEKKELIDGIKDKKEKCCFCVLIDSY